MIRLATFIIFPFIMSISQQNKTCLSSQDLCISDEQRAHLRDYLGSALIGTERQQTVFPSFNKITGNIDMSFNGCEPWNSCVGRCEPKANLRVTYPPYTCYCDALCTRYKDCCYDFFKNCIKRGEKTNNKRSSYFTNNKNLQFSCIDLNGKYGILMVDKCDLKWQEANILRKCKTEQIDPVTDYEGYVYKNRYCALCNGINYDETVHWEIRKCNDSKYCNGEYVPPEKSKFLPRICVYDIGNCSDDFPNIKGLEIIISQCNSYTGMVIGQKLKAQLKYKNAHCAMCNKASEVKCPQWRWQIKSRFGSDVDDGSKSAQPWAFKLYEKHNKTLPVDDFQVAVVTPEESKLMKQIPPSVSVLLNFGLNGKKNFYYSNQDQQSRNNNCPNYHIWDPFLDICRSLSCTAHFSLIDYQCVETDYSNPNERDELSDLIFGINLNKVVVCMAFQVKSVTNQQQKNVTERILKIFPTTLSSTLGINTNRISNMILLNKSHTAVQRDRKRSTELQFECAPLLSAFDFSRKNNVAIKFELSEPEPQFEGFEPSTDRIISLLITNTNLNTMSLLLDGFTLRLLGIHEETIVDHDEIQNWCLDGKKTKYMNHEFTILNGSIVNDDWKMNIYINKTEKIYKKGEYLANFISIGKYNDDGLAFVNGIVIVCENKSELFSDVCPRLTLKENEYEFIFNRRVNYTGELSIGKRILNVGEYKLEPNGDLLICYNVTISGVIMPYDTIQDYLGLVLTSISLFAMAITLFTYSIFPKLRNLPGMNLMNLVFILLVSQLTYLIGMRCSVKGLICKIVAVVIHYEIIASFFWTNVMAYDLYKTFGNNNILPYMREKKKFFKYYFAYAYLCPAALVSISVAIDTCKCTGDFLIGYGDDLCWITNPLATSIFFALPIGIILLINFIFYTITICSISKVTKIVKAATNKRGESDVNLYIKMSSVMGFTWIFGFVVPLTNNSEILYNIFTYIFVVTHSLQGLFICWAFVFNRRIFYLYKPYYIRLANTLNKAKLFLPKRENKFPERITSTKTTYSSRSSSLQTTRSNLSDD